MDRALSLALHTLTARLDRAADRILRAEEDLSYRRFLVLFMVDMMGMPTQRALAEVDGSGSPPWGGRSLLGPSGPQTAPHRAVRAWAASVAGRPGRQSPAADS